MLLGVLHMYCIPTADGFSARNSSDKQNRKRQGRGRPATPRPIIPTNSFAHMSALKDNIEILPAPDGKGMGAFTTVAISCGSILGEYSGEILTRKEVDARYWGKRKANKHDRKWRNSRKRRNQGISGDYIFDMGDDQFIDGEDADTSTWCRFANHASPSDGDGTACNVEAHADYSSSLEDDGMEGQNKKYAHGTDFPRLYFVALRNIEAGEELCYDYGEVYWDNH